MLKIKILRVLPFWLMGLIAVIVLQVAALLISPQQISKTAILSTASASAEPQVLGATTSIRGVGASTTTDTNITQVSAPNLSGITAKSYLVFDLASGQDLLEKNASEKLSIASLTKLLTGLVAYQNIDFAQTILITKSDVLKISPDLDFTVGDSVRASDVFNAMLIGSCNDAALTLANDVSGQTQKNFVGMMNSQAEALGMADSSFENPIGFDNPNNYSTARDIKTLITVTQQLPVFKDLGRMTNYQFTGSLGQTYSTVATNKLIHNYPDLQAIKTGFTYGAQGAMASKITINGHEAVIIILDSMNRESDTLKLRAALLNYFKWQ